jgi:imidazolonepropionase-like amidohydrolase
MKADWIAAAEAGATLCFVHGRVIDGRGRPPIEDGFVGVAGGRIEALGPMAELPPARNGRPRRVDLEGRTIMPGLIDCHAHLVYGGFRSLEEINRCPVETAAIGAVLNAARVLRAGYTTVRDLGTIGNVAVAVRDAVAAGRIRGPRVVASGRVLHTTAGHVDTLPGCWDGQCGLGVAVDGPHELLKAIRRQIRNGVDNIKLGASAAEGSPFSYTWMTTMNEEEIATAVGEAHRWGRTVAVHCQSYESVKFALRAGADTIEHATRMDDEAIDLFRNRRTVLVPTLCTLQSVLELGQALNLMPKQREEMAVNEPLWLESFQRARAASIPIAAGGDIGNRYPHGENARELELMVREGMSPLEALHAATGLAARAIHREGQVGALVPGALADLAILDADPLADIRTLQDMSRIRAVIQGGRAVAGTLLEEAPELLPVAGS